MSSGYALNLCKKRKFLKKREISNQNWKKIQRKKSQFKKFPKDGKYCERMTICFHAFYSKENSIQTKDISIQRNFQ